MQSKILLVIGALLAPLCSAAPTGNTEAATTPHTLKDRKLDMDPLFEVMAWKQGLDQILENAMKKNKAGEHSDNNNNNGNDNSNSKSHNSGWSHPIWPYE